MFLAVDLALFFNQYVNPVALSRIQWKYYIFYCVWLCFELFIVWKYFIETRNTPLGTFGMLVSFIISAKHRN